MSEVIRKLARSQMRTWAARHLQEVQGGLCPLCGLPIDMKIKGEGVIDHDHDTGRIRGVLHRSCNAAEGKAANAIGQWGAKSTDYASIIAFAERMVAYWHTEPTPFIYPMHKTEDERILARKANEKRRREEVKARREVLRRQRV